MKRKRNKILSRGPTSSMEKAVVSPFEFEGLVSFEEIKSYKNLDGKLIVNSENSAKITRPIGQDGESVKVKKIKLNNKNGPPEQNSATGKVAKENKTKSLKRKKSGTVKELANSSADVKKDVDVEAWKSIFAPYPVIEAIQELGFKEPTSIQKLTIPAAIKGRKDIIGAAETGSGKTLAFVIPIIHGILKLREIEEKNESQEVEHGESEAESECEMEEDGALDVDRELESDIDEGESENVEDISEAESDEDGNESEDETDSESEDTIDDDGEVDIDSEIESDKNKSIIEDENDSGNEDDADSVEEKIGCVKVIKGLKFETDFPTMINKDAKSHPKNKLRALIVTPTRELAVQIKKHSDAVLAKTDIKTAIVIGGLAQVKQDRVLKNGPEIVIGTPGRLWELLRQGNEHLSQLPFIRFLVIDETDRMLEKGHFQELKQLMGVINSNEVDRQKRQNFVFSATLTLVNEPPKETYKKKKKKVEMTKEMKLENFGKFVGVKESNCKTVDITRQFGTAEMLSEAKIFCEREEKDIYLYYFLRRFPARTLVFCNSISCVKRLHAVLSILECNPYSLHAMKQQRQRLKNLDRFTANSVSVLLATDVAARGLDIPGVDHIIHYDVPYTAEMYVHRSGRTARADQEGISVLLIDSKEMPKYRQLCATLNRTSDLTSFPVDDGIVYSLSKCVKLAKDIESTLRQRSKNRTNNSWIERNAHEAGIMLSGESGDSDEEGAFAENMKQKRDAAELQRKKDKLKSLLSQPLNSKMLSHRFPTYAGALNLPELMNVGSMLEPALNLMKNSKPQPKPHLPKLNRNKRKKFKRK